MYLSVVVNAPLQNLVVTENALAVLADDQCNRMAVLYRLAKIPANSVMEGEKKSGSVPSMFLTGTYIKSVSIITTGAIFYFRYFREINI